MERTEEVEHFFGVYLLYCTNPKYKGRVYIGYTVNPKRRIKQHNAGEKHGGAWRTSNKGPWIMVLIVHGFPNSTSALRFEWAWQHPDISQHLKHIPKKKKSQKTFEFSLVVLSGMLSVGPWCRLPLTIRWLDNEFFKEYCSIISAPLHMPICYGKVTSCKVKKKQNLGELQSEELPLFCSICGLVLEENELISCIKPSCMLIAHLICLGELFCKTGMILPIQGTCPACNTNVLWGDLIRKKLGCYGNLQEIADNESFSSDNSDY